LLGKLSGERSRWEQQLAELDGQLGQLPTAALLLAAFVTYLPAHPEDVRDRVLPAWARWVSGLWLRALSARYHARRMSCRSAEGC
jgi:dynein heavy chain 2